MKKLILLLAIVLIASPVFAGENLCKTPYAPIINECQEGYNDNHEEFDWGVYLHLILLEDDEKDWEFGLLNTFEVEREEYTALVGGKIYLNRISK